MVKQSEKKKLAETHLRLKVVVCLLLSSFPVVPSISRKYYPYPSTLGSVMSEGVASRQCHSCHNREPRTKKQHREKVFVVETKKS